MTYLCMFVVVLKIYRNCKLHVMAK